MLNRIGTATTLLFVRLTYHTVMLVGGTFFWVYDRLPAGWKHEPNRSDAQSGGFGVRR